MKKILALVLVLLLALPAAALAAPNVRYMSIKDAAFYENGELVLDLTGLNLEAYLSTYSSALSINAGASVENTPASMRAVLQLNGGELMAAMSGLDNAYVLNLNQINPFIGMILGTLDFSNMSIPQMPKVEITPAMRVEMVKSLFSEYAVATEGDNFDFQITQAQGKEIVDGLIAVAEMIGAYAGSVLPVQGYIQQARRAGITLELSGTYTATADGCEVTAEGKLLSTVNPELVFPVKMSFADRGTTADLVLTVDRNEGETVSIDLIYDATAAPNFLVDMLVKTNEQTVLETALTGSAINDFGGMDYSLQILKGSEVVESVTTFGLQTHTIADGTGFSIFMQNEDEHDMSGVYITYEGAPYIDANSSGQAGAVYIDVMPSEDVIYSLQATIIGLGFEYGPDTIGRMFYSTEGAVNLMTLDEAGIQNLMMQVSNAFASGVQQIMAALPNLQPAPATNAPDQLVPAADAQAGLIVPEANAQDALEAPAAEEPTVDVPTVEVLPSVEAPAAE